MLKASSLLYAIFVCLIVSLLCGSLIIIFNYQFRLKQQYFLEEELVDASTTNFLQIIDNINTDELNIKGSVQFEDDRFTTFYNLSKWGFYNLIKTKTTFKKDTVYKVALVGGKVRKDEFALYLSDLDKPLNIGGTTKIIGDVKISKYGVKPAYINNHNFTGTKLVYGNIGVSERRLPPLQEFNEEIIQSQPQEVLLEELAHRTLNNSFYKPTIIVYADGIRDIANVSLSGNIILQSKDSISIKRTCKLNDILIKAPIVAFEDNFSGTLQVFAKTRVHLAKNVSLKYPSSIYINNDSEKLMEIFLDEKSKVAGGIVLTGKSYQNSLNRLVTIEKDATVIGDVYCYGKTQLKGKVIGTVYTDRFYLKTASSIYENYIIDGEIDKTALPENFIGLPLFPKQNMNYELIKEL